MRRIPEPELMLGDKQARAYAEADFAEPHDQFVQSILETCGRGLKGYVLDLGCGPADVTIRFAKAFPECLVHGVDGSEAMLKYGRRMVRRHGLQERIRLFRRYLPAQRLPRRIYDVVISNSLLHHLDDPGVLWESIRRFARPGAAVMVRDLMRPASRAEARRLTKTYAGDAPAVLKKDFYNSLLAAYTPDEVRQQLERTGLQNFRVEVVSDRHLQAAGRV